MTKDEIMDLLASEKRYLADGYNATRRVKHNGVYYFLSKAGSAKYESLVTENNLSS